MKRMAMSAHFDHIRGEVAKRREGREWDEGENATGWRFHPRSHENKKPKEGRSPDARRLYFRKGNGSRRTTKAWISFAFVITSARSRSTAHGGTLPRASAGSSTAPLRSALRMTQRQSPLAVQKLSETGRR